MIPVVGGSLQIAVVRPLHKNSEERIYAAMKIDTRHMLANATSASDLLKALANRHRLLLVCQMVDGERSVGDLANALGIRDSTVSQHLALLRRDGIVTPRRDGQVIYYAIANPTARRLLEVLYEAFCAPGKMCTDVRPPNRRGRPKRSLS